MKMRKMIMMGLALLATYVVHAQRSISVNFGSDRAAIDDVDEAVGYVPVPGRYWVDVSNSGNTGGIPSTLAASNVQDNTGTAVLGSQLYACSRGGSWYSGSTATLTAKLLYGFLDDSNGSNPGGFKVTGIPYAKYRVIIYRNIDAAEGTTGLFGHHTVNDTAYSYVSGALTAGSTANWGVTRKTQLVVGENTMVVTNLTGDLTVLTASPGGGVRGCISGFQIEEESAFDVISVKVGSDGTYSIPDNNFTNYAGVAGLGIKCARWNNMATPLGTTITNIVKSRLINNIGVTITNTAPNNPYTANGSANLVNNHANTRLLGRYMDLSASTQYTITVKDIPYAYYDVYMIFSGDGGAYSPAIINGTSYYGFGNGTFTGTATWGNRNATWTTLQSACGNSYLREGYNYLRVAKVSGSVLTLKNTISGSRGTLAGFQIAEASAPSAISGDIFWVGGASGSWTDGTKWNTGVPPIATDTVVFSAPSVTVDLNGGSVAAAKIKVYGTALTLNNGSFTAAPELENHSGTLVLFETDSALSFVSWPAAMYKAGAGTVTVESVAYGAADTLSIFGTGGLKVTNGGTIGTLRMENENSTFEVSGGTLAITTALQPQWRSNLKITGSAVVTVAGVSAAADVNYEFSGSSLTTVTGTWHYNSWSDVLFKDSAKVITTAGMQYGDNDWVRVMDNADLTCTQLRFNETTGVNTTFTMTGGKVTATATGTSKNAAFHLAHWSNGNPRFYLNGGEMIATNGTMALGVDGTCYVYLGGTQIKVKRFEPATSSEFYTTNGVLNVGVDGIVNAGTKPLYLAGGTVTAWGNWSSAKAMMLTNTVAGLPVPGDVSFDTASFAISLTGAIDGEGGLAKAGAGTLSLAGANTYAGMTTIQAGTLVPKHVTALGAGALSLEGGTLDLTASGAVVPTGTKAWTVSGTPTLKLTHNAANKMSISSITGSGVVSLSLDVSGVSALGAYKLISTTTDLTTNNFTLAMTGNAPGFVAELTSDAAGIYLNVTGLPAVTWNVDGDGAWDTTTANWSKNGVGGFTFTDGDFTILPDRVGISAATLALTAPYSTGSMTVSATNTAYTIAGAALTATRVTLDPGSSLTLTNEGSRITENIIIPQNTTLAIPNIAVLPAGFTPAVADYPVQSRLRFANGSDLTSFAAVAGKDAQIMLVKTAAITDEYTVNGGQTFVVDNGGALTTSTNIFVDSANRMIVSGGSVLIGQHLWLNTYNSYGRGRLEVSGGALTVTGDIRDNRDSYFDVIQTGGSVTISALRAQQFTPGGVNEGGAYGNNTYTLSGGVFTVGYMQGGNASGYWQRGLALYLGGGTLRASASFTANANTIQLTGVNGNTVIDTQANTLRIDYPVFGAGGFTKIGAGTLDLRGNNTFGGVLTISEGKVEARNVNALGAGAMTISGGTLDLTTTGVMAPSARDYTLVTGSVKMKMNSASPQIGCDLLQGNTVAGPGAGDTFTFVLNFGGATKALDQYRLMTASSFLADTNRLAVSVENGPTLESYSFAVVDGALYVTLVGPYFVGKYEWNVAGAVGDWDTTSENWKNGETAGLVFETGAGALFKDVAGQPAVTVTLTEAVEPATLSIENNATAFTFAGTDPLTSGMLSCAGTNTVVFEIPLSASSLTLASLANVTLAPGSVIANTFAIPQSTLLTVAETATLAGGFTTGGGDYPNQSHLRFAGGTVIDALPAPQDAMYSIAKAVENINGYTVDYGQTFRIEPIAQLLSTNAFSMKNGTLRIEGGIMTTPRLILGDAGGVYSTVQQTGGTVTVTGTVGTLSDDGWNAASALFGHWSSTSTYELSGGTLSVENALARLGHDGTIFMNISGAGVMRTKGIRLDQSTLNLNVGGTLELGEYGVSYRGDFVWFKFGGGMLRAYTNFTFNALNDTTNVLLVASTTSTIDVNDRAIAFNAPLSGAGSLVVVDSSVAKGGVLNLDAANTFTGTVRLDNGTLNLNAANAMSGITVNNGLLNMGAANASLSAMTIAGGTVVPKHADAFGAADIGLAGGTLDVRAAGAVVPAKALNVSAASTLKTKFDTPANLSVGSMTGVLSLEVDITGASTSVEYKLLSASSQPAAEDFALIGAYGDKKAELIFKADGVYLNLKAAATLIFLR